MPPVSPRSGRTHAPPLPQIAIQRPGRLDPSGTARGRGPLPRLAFPPTYTIRSRRSTSGTWRPAGSDSRSPPSRNSMMTAASRRRWRAGPAGRRPTGPASSGRPGRRPDAGRGVLVGPRSGASGRPDPGEPASGRVAGVALADLDQPTPDVLAVKLGRADLGMVLGRPVGQAPDRLLVGLDGVVGVPLSPQRQLPGDGEHGEVGMLHAGYIGDMERCASSVRRRHRTIRPAQQVRQLGRVGHRLIAVAVVYARSSAALSRENQDNTERSAIVIRTSTGVAAGAQAPVRSWAAMRKIGKALHMPSRTDGEARQET